MVERSENQKIRKRECVSGTYEKDARFRSLISVFDHTKTKIYAKPSVFFGFRNFFYARKDRALRKRNRNWQLVFVTNDHKEWP